MSIRQIMVDQLNNLEVNIKILNQEMTILERAGQEDTVAYEALNELEWELQLSAVICRRRLRKNLI